MNCQECGMNTANKFKCEVCGTVRVDVKKLDALTNRYTAFTTFAAFLVAMKHSGSEVQNYTPTIHPNNKFKGRPVAGRVALIEAVRAAGFKVYDGSKVA